MKKKQLEIAAATKAALKDYWIPRHAGDGLSVGDQCERALPLCHRAVEEPEIQVIGVARDRWRDAYNLLEVAVPAVQPDVLLIERNTSRLRPELIGQVEIAQFPVLE